MAREQEGTREREGVKEFYTVEELAERLQLTRMTIYRLVKRGEIPYYQIGRSKRFRAGDVEEFLERCRRVGAGEEKSDE